MSALAPYVVDAIVLEHRSPSQLARDHDISRSWIYRVLERFQEGGYEALEPRSRRPPSCSRQAGPEVQAEIVRLRTELIEAGHDGGPQTILYHLADRVEEQPSAATVWRVLKRHGLIMPQPQKRPKSSFIRFEAKLPNETWQVDATPWQLAVGRQVEILNFLDDHSRLHLAARAFSTIRAGDVAETFHAAAREFDLPAWAASRTSAGARIPAIADPGHADQAPVVTVRGVGAFKVAAATADA